MAYFGSLPSISAEYQALDSSAAILLFFGQTLVADIVSARRPLLEPVSVGRRISLRLWASRFYFASIESSILL